MSETTGAGCSNPPDRIKIDTIGLPAPGVDIRVDADGEMLVRGACVMRGYRNQPSRTDDTIVDGWLRTGDLVTVDDEGYVSIVDRKKELIINAMGKNMSPVAIESQLKAATPLIAHVCAIGDNRPFNVALIVVDAEAVRTWETAAGAQPDHDDPRSPSERVSDELTRAIAVANRRLSRVEQIKRFTILHDDWPPSGDELTPTMKLKRRPISLKYAATIDALYDSDISAGETPAFVPCEGLA